MKTRFAPSPTGFLHIGSLRTALFAWLAARSNGGEFYLRIEDTDLERSDHQYTQLIYDALKWVGLDWDNNEVMVQSERQEIYRHIAQELLDKGDAYHCHCTKEELEAVRERQLKEKQPLRYEGTCRNKNLPQTENSVLRLKVAENESFNFDDLHHGQYTIQSFDIDDWIIMRPGNYATYNFSVVIDDNAMGIDCVLRGDDHLNNTPKQVILYRMLGYDVPKFCHIPMILDQDGARLSKRSGAANALKYKEQGVTPQALVNMLARLGWSYGDQEIFTLEELIEKFSFEGLQKSPACLDEQKLNWLNKQHLISLDLDLLADQLQDLKILENIDREKVKIIIQIFRERATFLQDFETQSKFLFQVPSYDNSYFKEEFPDFKEENRIQIVQLIEQDPTFETFFKSLKKYAKEIGCKVPQLALPLRYIICGTVQAPDFPSLLKFLGVEEVLNRLSTFKF